MFGLEQWGLAGLFIGSFLAATVLPFSSDALYIAVLLATKEPVSCLILGTAGNWLGGVVTYYMARLVKWEWVEKIFRVSHEKLEKQKPIIDKWGVWVALLSWVPFIGDVFVLALGFYRTPQVGTLLLMLVGKAARFLVWSLLFI